MDEYLRTIQDIGDALGSEKSTSVTFSKLLDDLNPIVIRTAQDEEFRNGMANSIHTWSNIKECLENIDIKMIQGRKVDEELRLYLRTIRGIVILMRNLSVSNQEIPQEQLLQNLVIRVFTTIIKENLTTYGEMETSLYVAILSFLHNITKNVVIFDKTIIDSLFEFFKYPVYHPKDKKEILFPYVLYFINMTQNDDFLYYFLKRSDKDIILYNFLIKEIMNEHSNLFKYMERVSIDMQEIDITSMDAILLKCFKRIACNGSFAPYLEDIEESDNDKFFCYLRLLQLVITSSEDWDKFELTAIMSWCFKIFEKAATSTESYFRKGKDIESEASILHKKLLITLDMICSLCKYEHVQKFILHYEGVEKLISLLHVLQKHLFRINFQKDNKKGSINREVKTTNELGDKITDITLLEKRVDYDNFKVRSTNFPECKSLIIEILAMLTYQRKEVQDKMRDLHALEIILSNCVIDDNDPFIKERSIVCIRFLLEGNQLNQDFVVKLEAKKAVQDDVLSEAGFEVKGDGSGGINLMSKDSTHISLTDK